MPVVAALAFVASARIPLLGPTAVPVFYIRDWSKACAISWFGVFRTPRSFRRTLMTNASLKSARHIGTFHIPSFGFGPHLGLHIDARVRVRKSVAG
ncbi:uncharacterized protein EV422DRAFT_202092 [Fimicolochytrium jonesii]|uniref:uncharacterized protein n=1 Tax=Fimicolochytrium jonesii TaxID=1396493 RepID=UPI0022FEE667|nr:uncharacterized protein EV422DRAFT_202092 [Fimicolochytrium jonesii]KAI8817999.1 hypothetical protein EV422DRAFT_202092 [Fimicolochytrium jonesii]